MTCLCHSTNWTKRGIFLRVGRTIHVSHRWICTACGHVVCIRMTPAWRML